MKLWTIQTSDVWQILQSEGVYRANSQGMPDQSFEKPYRWMAHQLAQCIQPPTECQCPLWAWHQWQHNRKFKPDLRTTSYL